MNKLIKHLYTSKDGFKYGIIETPCFPAKYYAGMYYIHEKDYTPACNDTHLYHRTIEKAETQIVLPV